MLLDRKVDILSVDGGDLRDPLEISAGCFPGEKSLYSAAEDLGEDQRFYWRLPVIRSFLLPYPRR